jgi:hypothetical protein
MNMPCDPPEAQSADWPCPLPFAQLQVIGSGLSNAPGMRAEIVAGLQILIQVAPSKDASTHSATPFLARALREYFSNKSVQAEAFLQQFAQRDDEPPALLALIRHLLGGGMDAAQLLQQAMQLCATEAYVDVAIELLLWLFSKGALNNSEGGINYLVQLMSETLQRPAAAERLLSMHRKQMPDSALAQTHQAQRIAHALSASAHFKLGKKNLHFREASLDSPEVQDWLRRGQILSRAGLSGAHRVSYIHSYAPITRDLISFRDASFVLGDDEHALLYCELSTQYKASDANWSLCLHPLSADGPALEQLMPAILEQAELRVSLRGGRSLSLNLEDAQCAPEPFLLANYAPMLAYESHTDLQRSEAELWTSVRKSFKSIISKTAAQTTLHHLNREQRVLQLGNTQLDWEQTKDILLYLGNADPNGLFFARGQFDSYRDWIMEFGGEICIVWHHRLGPIAASIITDYFGFSTYCWGRSAGPVLDPLTKTSHLALWDAIRRAKARGNTRFNLGNFDADGTPSRKLNAIAKFKHGFATNLVRLMQWSKILD